MGWIQTNNGPIWEGGGTPQPSSNTQQFSVVGQPFNSTSPNSSVSSPALSPAQLAEQEYKSLWGTRKDGSDLNNVQATSAATGKPMVQVMQENPQFNYLLDQMPNWTSLNQNYISPGAGQIHDDLSWIQKTLSKAAPYAAAVGSAFLGPAAGLAIGSGLSAFNKGWSGVMNNFGTNALSAYGADFLNSQGVFGNSMASSRNFSYPNILNSKPGTPSKTGVADALKKGSIDSEEEDYMDWLKKIKKNPLGTALGAFSMLQGANVDTPNFEWQPQQQIGGSLSPELGKAREDLLGQMQNIDWNAPGGYTAEELAAAREGFKVNLNDYLSEQNEMLASNLESRGMESSSEADRLYAKLSETAQEKAAQFERGLMLDNAQLRRSDLSQKQNQYNNAMQQLAQLEQVAAAKQQADYARAFDQYQADYQKAVGQKQGYQNFASQALAKIFFDDSNSILEQFKGMF